MTATYLDELGLTFDGKEYTRADGVSWEHLDKAIIEGVFGFCGCGRPDDFVRLVGRALRLMVDYYEYNQHGMRANDPGWREVFKKYHADMEAACGNTGSVMLLQYVFDKHELTEHGGSVNSAWPTPKGYAVLAAIEQLEEE